MRCLSPVSHLLDRFIAWALPIPCNGPIEQFFDRRISPQIASLRAHSLFNRSTTRRNAFSARPQTTKRVAKWGGLALTLAGEIVRCNLGYQNSEANTLYRVLLTRELVHLFGGVLRRGKAHSRKHSQRVLNSHRPAV